MIFPRSILSALLAVAIAIEGFAPASVVTSPATRLYEAPELKPWGGPEFRESNADFPYSDAKPDLSTVEMTKNLDNIDKITRMQKVIWPEFSWFSKIGDPSSRVYVTFAQDVSRIGYDDEGQIWSLICPQRGFAIPILGTGFIEVTVTGVRGWVDEDTNSCYADVSVVGIVWIEPQLDNPLVGALKSIYDKFLPGAPFPFSKANAVKVHAHDVGKPYKDEWPMTNGTSTEIFQPVSRRYFDEGAYSVYNLEVEMGKKIDKGIEIVDKFDQMVLDLFNMASGGILREGQRVSWNVWTTAPEAVDQDEWRAHADLWFNSMNIKHEYPDGKSIRDREVTKFDGTEYEADIDIKEAGAIIKKFIGEAKEFMPEDASIEMLKDPLICFMMEHFMEKRIDHIKDDIKGIRNKIFRKD